MGKRKQKQVKAKGEVGYIAFKKRLELMTTIFIFLIAVAIFVLGLALNKWDKGNIFTIIACLFVIPMARFATLYILLFPFKSVTEKQAAEVASHAKPGSIIYADVIITSEKKAMGIPFLIVTDNKVFGVRGSDKDKAYDIRDYLQDVITRRGYDYKVSIADDYTGLYTLLNKSGRVVREDFDSDEDWDAFNEDRSALCREIESLMP